MTQREIVCPRCRQINVRSDGSFADRMFTNPKYPQWCTMCQTDLKTGERPVIFIPIAWTMWFVIYMIHALVMSFLYSFPALLLALLLAGFGIAPFAQLYFLVLAVTLVGMAHGIKMAEQKRRRGKILS